MDNEKSERINFIYCNAIEHLKEYINSIQFKVDVDSLEYIDNIIVTLFQELEAEEYSPWSKKLTDADIDFFEYYYDVNTLFEELNETAVNETQAYVSYLLGTYWFHNDSSEKSLLYLKKSADCRESLYESGFEISKSRLAEIYEGIAQLYSQTGQTFFESEFLEKAIKWHLIDETEKSGYQPDTTDLMYELFKLQKRLKQKADCKKTKKQLIDRITPRLKANQRAKEIYREMFWLSWPYRENKALKLLLSSYFVICLLCFFTNLFINFNGGADLLLLLSLHKYDGSYAIDTYREKKIEDERYLCAMSSMSLEQYEKAESQLLTLLDEYKKTNSENSKIIGQINMKIGDCCLALSDYENAYDYYLKSYTAFKSSYGKSSENASVARIQVAACKLAISDFDVSNSDALEAYNEMKYFGNRISASITLSRIMCKKGKMEEAVFWAEKATGYFGLKRLAKRQTDSWLRQACESFRVLGTVYNEFGYYEKAQEQFLTAEEYYKKCRKKDLCVEFNLYNGLFVSYCDDIPKAIEYGNKALSAAKEVGNIEAELGMSTQIASLEHNESTLIGNLKKCEEIFGKYSKSTALQYYYLGSYYLENKNSEKSLEYLLKSLEIQKSLLDYSSEETIGLYLTLAQNYINLEDYISAARFVLDSAKALENRDRQFNSHYCTLLLVAMELTYKSDNTFYTSVLSEVCYLLCEENGIKSLNNVTVNSLLEKYRSNSGEGSKEYNELSLQAEKTKDKIYQLSFFEVLSDVFKECGFIK